MEKLNKSICIYVSYLRALYFVHQQHHWICSGPAFFALHKLFEEIYKSAEADVDEAAEKFVGLFGDESLSMKTQLECFNQILSSLDEDDDLVARSLALEEKFLAFSKGFYKALKTEHDEDLTMGLDDMLMEIASHREQACYHLKRTIK